MYVEMMATKPSFAHVVPESHSIAQLLQALIALIRNGIRTQRALCFERKKRSSAASPLVSARARVWNSQIRSDTTADTIDTRKPRANVKDPPSNFRGARKYNSSATRATLWQASNGVTPLVLALPVGPRLRDVRADLRHGRVPRFDDADARLRSWQRL